MLWKALNDEKAMKYNEVTACKKVGAFHSQRDTKNLKDRITGLSEKEKELLALKAGEEVTFLPNLLMWTNNTEMFHK